MINKCMYPCAPHLLCAVGKSHGEPKVGVRELLEFEVWGVEQGLLPYLQQMVLFNVSVEELIINPYVYGLLDGPGKVM